MYLEDNKCCITWRRVSLNNYQWIIVKMLHILFGNCHISVLCIISPKDIDKWLGMFCFGWRNPNRRRSPHLHVHNCHLSRLPHMVQSILQSKHQHTILCSKLDNHLMFFSFPMFLSSNYMMTSSNGNIFRVTGHLCGEFTGHRWIPDAKLWCFLWSASEWTVE